MNQKYNEIDIYNNSSVIYYRRNNIFIPFWITLLFVGLFIFIMLSCFYKYTLVDIYYGKIISTEESNYIMLEVDEDFILKKNR